MTPQEAKGTLLNTDYPIDKIVGYSAGSQSVPAFGVPTITVPHGMAYAPLYYIKWSNTADFAVSNDEIGVSFNRSLLFSNADSTNIYLFPFNNTGGSLTFYYRIIYFMPTDVDVIQDETQSDFDDFILNTDYNYTKILDQGLLNSSSATIAHNLGYYPQVEAWYVRASDGRLVHVVENAVHTSDNPRVQVTQDSVIFTNGSFLGVSAWHYKIYLDEV